MTRKELVEENKMFRDALHSIADQIADTLDFDLDEGDLDSEGE